jgi:F-type H+-transporting ATPase subunit a
MSALLLALLLQATPAQPAAAAPAPAPSQALEAPAQGVGSAGSAAPGQAPAEPSVEVPAADETHAAHESAGEQEGTAAVIMHHVLDQPVFGLPSKHLLYFVLAALIVMVIARAAVRSYHGGTIPSGIGAVVEMLVLFVRDDIAEPSIGHGDGRKFTPLLCSFFFFILVAALLGLVPLPGYSAGKWSLQSTTSTANITVTMGLALVSFAAQQWAGIARYGVVRHFRNLIPPGVPLLMLPVMIPVEIISMFTKPFALMVRLFANMIAGHMVVTTLILLIAIVAKLHWLGGVAMAPVSIALSLFILLLEVLVAFVQAFIFTLLSAIFIGMYAHPAH